MKSPWAQSEATTLPTGGVLAYTGGMTYEVIQDGDEWRVEAIDYESEGEVCVAIFSGPGAEARAREYALFKEPVSRVRATL